jgi:hypothetical protein
MNRTVRLAVGYGLLLLAVLFGVGVVLAAAGTAPVAASNHTNGTNTSAPTNATDTPNDGGGGTDVNIGIVDGSNDAPDRSENIRVSLGPNSYVSNVEFNKQSETADITIVNQRSSLRLTFTDSNSINPEQTAGTFNQRTENIPRGTYTVRVPATVDEENGENQLVTIVGNVPNNVYVSNGQTGGASPLDEILTVSTALLGMLIFLAVLTARTGYKVWVKSETGSPETLDGTEAGNRAYGMTEQLDEGGDDGD